MPDDSGAVGAEPQRRERMAPERLAALLRDRTLTVGTANALLLIVSVILTISTYGLAEVSRTLVGPFVLMLIVTLLAVLYGVKALPETFADNFNLPALPTWRHTAEEKRYGWYLGTSFTVLLVLVGNDFYCVGRLIAATGGFLGSPFSQLPAVMLVLGFVMAKRPRTRVVILFIGICYFWLLQDTELFHQVISPPARHLSSGTDAIVITSLNLVVSAIVIHRKQDDEKGTNKEATGSQDG